MKRLRWLLLLSLLSTGIGLASANHPIMKFESAEHINIGDQVKLKFDDTSDATAGTKLTLSNGLSLTYGEIVALGGDFYGMPDQPISQGIDNSDRRARFLLAYSLLSHEKKSVIEAQKILQVIQDEQQQLADGLSKGKKPADIYERMETDHNILWNCITGGFCKEDFPNTSPEEFRKIYFLKEGRYLKLADTNFDHFGHEAILSYTSGHALALDTALQAGRENNKKGLIEAYAINAFACHYLSDLFSAGHMRTPHWALYQHVSPAAVGSVLAIYMHNEDGELGLTVSNKHGDTWKTQGDRYYFETDNQRNNEILLHAMQISADAVYTAYSTGTIPTIDQTLQWIPDLDKLDQEKKSRLNHAPMFVDDPQHNTVLRRTNVTDPYTYEWTTYWAGWATLTELTNAFGMPDEAKRRV